MAFAIRNACSSFLTRGLISTTTTTTTVPFNATLRLISNRRLFATEAQNEAVGRLRNIGISAHIDSGKTTLTERILFYTGRINQIHEVRGKDGVGAKMDSMELEREKGITIQSAATYCYWGDNRINIIDTPGHVDFTIEVERALRVLDSAVLVLCGVSGVQSQTLTVDRQMKRYKIPRIAFINKLDRSGANPWKVIDQVKEKLHLNAAPVQLPIGIENLLEGVVDIVKKKAYFFDGNKGSELVESEVPEGLKETMEEKRQELINAVGDVDDQLGEILVVEERAPTEEELTAAIRRATIANKFVPVFMGSAFKNKGVQPLLNGVVAYLPSPSEVKNEALNLDDNETKVELVSDPSKPLVGLAFKLEEGRFGQLTYMRIYQGTLTKGTMIHNVNTGKKIKVPRLVRMHSNEMEDVDSVGAGEICAMFGVDCQSGNTFTDGTLKYAMSSMHVPDPVMSLAVSTDNKKSEIAFSKALHKFQKEDPTFRVRLDPESGQTIISGMGELHLFIYTERMKREYGVNVVTGKPQVAFRETIRDRVPFAYTHKKQSGGQGQYAKVCGYLEPLPEDRLGENEFSNEVIGGAIPPEFMSACEKGFYEILEKGPIIGHPITGVKIVLNDGASHPVDSSDLAFRLATQYAVREAFAKGRPTVLEPIMKVEITAPTEYQGVIVSSLNKRKGVVVNSEAGADYLTIEANVSLNNMFGYSTDLRSLTAGKGEFTMEYATHNPATRELQEELINAFKKKQEEQKK